MDAEAPIQQEPLHTLSFSAPLTAQQFYHGDPLLVFVKDKLHLDTLRSTAIFFVCSLAYNFSYINVLQDCHFSDFLALTPLW